MKFHANSRRFLILGGVFLVASCEQALKLLEEAKAIPNDPSNYVDIPGESAFDYLASTYKDSTVSSSAILAAMGVAQKEQGEANLRLSGFLAEDDNDKLPEITDEALDVLVASQANKLSFVGDDFKKIEIDFFTKATVGAALTTTVGSHINDTVTWARSTDEFTVSTLDKLPVRDQGARGTCAAYAGVAQMESYLIKRYALDGIDLSEQRFYYMSKPENWANGGSANSQGSNTGTGYAKSNGYDYDDKTYPTDSPPDFNIPIETDCPYITAIGDTDTLPQAADCKGTGVAKVTDFTAWVYQWKERISTAQDVYDMLNNDDEPVLISTKLSDNWENNDGIITLAASGASGVTSDAAGHAYLVVGAKKLDEAAYPNEGGMCFIIRNSWGRGWGVNGLSCMTLAWFNAWRYDTDFGQLISMDLDISKFQDAKDALETTPDGLAEPTTDKPGANPAATTAKRRGTVSFLTNNLMAEDKTLGALIDDKNEFWKVLYTTTDDTIEIQGILDGNTNLTHVLDLILDGDTIKYEFQDKGKIEVGSIDTEAKIITLCTQKYGQICDLNYVKETQQFSIGITKAEFLRQDSSEPYDWSSFDLAGYGVEFSLPGKSTSVDMRFLSKGVTTNPLRFTVDPKTTNISYQGTDIGSIKDVSFCSGDTYKDVCRVVRASDKFRVLFKAKK